MIMSLLQSIFLPEQPHVWPKPGEKPWKVSQRIQGHTPLLRSVTCLLRHRSVSLQRDAGWIRCNLELARKTWEPPTKRGRHQWGDLNEQRGRATSEQSRRESGSQRTSLCGNRELVAQRSRPNPETCAPPRPPGAEGQSVTGSS